MKNFIIYGAIAVIVILLIIIAYPQPKTPSIESDPNTTNTAAETPGEVPTTSPSKTNSPSAPSQTPSSSASTPIYITSPALGGEFTIGKLNLIKWSRETGITAGLYLVNASNEVILGWITPTVTAHQTSYAWDTKDVALNRVSGVRKSVLPGRYYIKMKFDGPISEAKSNTFYILYPEQDSSFTHHLAIQNFRFVPASIAVKAGEKITIQNKDSNTYTLIPKNPGETIVLSPGETKTILTDNLSEGPQGYSAENYSTTNLQIDIYK